MADFKRFKVGHTVKLANLSAYDRYSRIWGIADVTYEQRYTKPVTFKVVAVKWGQKYEYQERSKSYENSQLVKLSGSTSWLDAENFELVESENSMSTILAIEVDRPCLVKEIRETTVDGKVVIKTVGDEQEFENSRAANIWASEQIANSIRETNTYRKFRIYQEKSIAQAKKPEIEFV